MSNHDILMRAAEQCSKNTTCDGCAYHRMREVEHCPIFDNVRTATGGLYTENQKLRELLTIAKNDIWWLVLKELFAREKLNGDGVAALFFMNNDGFNDEKIRKDFEKIYDFLEEKKGETT